MINWFKNKWSKWFPKPAPQIKLPVKPQMTIHSSKEEMDKSPLRYKMTITVHNTESVQSEFASFSSISMVTEHIDSEMGKCSPKDHITCSVGGINITGLKDDYYRVSIPAWNMDAFLDVITKFNELMIELNNQGDKKN